MAEDQNKNTVDDTTKTTEYEDVCYICRRPESVAGKMIHIQDNICICNDCMQKTFDTMNTGGFNMGDIMNMNNGKMPNISMINLAPLSVRYSFPKSSKLYGVSAQKSIPGAFAPGMLRSRSLMQHLQNIKKTRGLNRPRIRNVFLFQGTIT